MGGEEKAELQSDTEDGSPTVGPLLRRERAAPVEILWKSRADVPRKAIAAPPRISERVQACASLRDGINF